MKPHICHAAPGENRPLTLLLISIASILCVGLVLMGVQRAVAVNLTPMESTITVKMQQSTDPIIAAQEAEARVSYDLYKVAGAIQDAGYDAYHFEPIASLANISGVDWAKPSSDAYKAIAEAATAQVAPWASESTALKPVRQSIPLGETASGLDAGLYLIIAYGSGLGPDQYKTDVPGETIAVSERNVFTFQPQVVAVPSRAVEAGQVPSTAGTGEWQNDVTAYLKPGIAPRYGTLQINKTLLTYDDQHPAGFVFQIDAYNSEADYNNGAAAIFSTVESIPFTAAGMQSVTVGRIPAGSYVRVTEVYSGTSYTVQGEGLQIVSSLAPDPVGGGDLPQGNGVSFVNDFNGNSNHSGSVVNRFENGDAGWNWDGGEANA